MVIVKSNFLCLIQRRGYINPNFIYDMNHSNIVITKSMLDTPGKLKLFVKSISRGDKKKYLQK